MSDTREPGWYWVTTQSEGVAPEPAEYHSDGRWWFRCGWYTSDDTLGCEIGSRILWPDEHDCLVSRVSELLSANTREVERRRKAEELARDIAEALYRRAVQGRVRMAQGGRTVPCGYSCRICGADWGNTWPDAPEEPQVETHKLGCLLTRARAEGALPPICPEPPDA